VTKAEKERIYATLKTRVDRSREQWMTRIPIKEAKPKVKVNRNKPKPKAFSL